MFKKINHLSLLFLLILFTLVFKATNASESHHLKIGQKIRIDVDTTKYDRFLIFIKIPKHENRKIIGHFVSETPDSISLVTDNDTERINVSKDLIKNMYIRSGDKRELVNGLLIGAGFGTLFTAIAARGHSWDEENNIVTTNNPKKTSALLISSGLLLGGTIGWFVKSDKWSKIDKDKLSINFNLKIKNETMQVVCSLNF